MQPMTVGCIVAAQAAAPCPMTGPHCDSESTHMSSKMIKPVSLAVGAAFLGSLSFVTLHLPDGTVQTLDLP